MQSMSWLLVAVFLPLFPFSMVFNLIFQRATSVWARLILLLLWPASGLWLLDSMQLEPPDWVFLWALSSAVLYAFRSVVIREISVWTGFITTSAWSLLWLLIYHGVRIDELVMFALAFSIPFALLVILVARLERQYESAYAGVVTGLAQEQPRMTGLLVVVLFAAIGTPMFPSFFAMLSSINSTITEHPLVASGILLVWFLWSWSAIRLLQELLVGTPAIRQHDDVGPVTVMFYGIAFVLLVASGLYMSEVML